MAVILVGGSGCCISEREWLLYWSDGVVVLLLKGVVVVLVGGSGCCIDEREWLLY